MASASNGTGNLVDEFEESFQECVHALTKQESSTGIDKDEIGLEVDETTWKFIDLARQMEAFFIQKRFLLSVMKPELVLKEENVDLRLEINRKDEMIKKHYDRIDHWKNMLSDSQPQHLSHPSSIQPSIPPQIGFGGIIGGIASDLRPLPIGPGSMGMSPQSHPGPGPMQMPGMSPAMQAQLQAQHMQQQHMMQAQQMHMQQMQFGKLAKR